MESVPTCLLFLFHYPTVPVAEILIKHSKLKKKLSSESSFQELPDVVVRTLDPESLGRCKQLNVGKIDHPSVGSLHSHCVNNFGRHVIRPFVIGSSDRMLHRSTMDKRQATIPNA